MEWIEVIIKARGISVEELSDLLISEGSAGVAIEDQEDLLEVPNMYGAIIDEKIYNNYQEVPVVKGYFEKTESHIKVIDSLYNTIKEEVPDYKREDIICSPLDESDWNTEWKKYYHSLMLSHWLKITPIWEKDTEKRETNTIYLDPGMAFGTGSHPTTRLAVNLMETIMTGNETVIDVGTGSGILAIVAKKLGAKSIVAYDYDPSVIETAKYNISLNFSQSDIVVEVKDKLNDVDAHVDLIIANILAEILLPLIPQAYQNLVDNGDFILSGIFYDQFNLIKDRLIAHDFYINEYRRSGEWYAIHAKKGRKNRPKDTI